MGAEAAAAAPVETLVALGGVDVALAGRLVLERVDLTVAPGEIVTVVGPNGAGKTTLVRVVLGLQRPQAGRVWRRPGLVVGYVPQRFDLDPVLPLSVRRFLSLPWRHGRERLAAALREAAVPGVLDRPVHELSGGQFRRVLLARALLREPDLLVLDEPLQGIDVTGQAAMFELVARLRRERGCGVLMVSHDLHLVMRATDRVICLNRHVCCHGAPESVSRHPEYRALFGDAAARALAVYSHEHDHAHDLAGEVVAPSGGDRGEAAGREGSGA